MAHRVGQAETAAGVARELQIWLDFDLDLRTREFAGVLFALFLLEELPLHLLEPLFTRETSSLYSLTWAW